jgi:hypothetical protein
MWLTENSANHKEQSEKSANNMDRGRSIYRYVADGILRHPVLVLRHARSRLAFLTVVFRF